MGTSVHGDLTLIVLIVLVLLILASPKPLTALFQTIGGCLLGAFVGLALVAALIGLICFAIAILSPSANTMALLQTGIVLVMPVVAGIVATYFFFRSG